MLTDSNILIYGANQVDKRLDSILGRTDLSVASVSLIEALGYHRLDAQRRRWLEVAVSRMRVIPLVDKIVQRAIALRQKKKMALADAIIAATALEHKLPLVTRNVNDYKLIPELQLINPFATP